jgi:hypothetical protein
LSARSDPQPGTGDTAGWGIRDGLAGAVAAGVLIAAIWAGSLGFHSFDSAADAPDLLPVITA